MSELPMDPEFEQLLVSGVEDRAVLHSRGVVGPHVLASARAARAPNNDADQGGG